VVLFSCCIFWPEATMAEIPQAGVTVSQVTSGYTIINGPLSPLTTTFTYPSSCINHWVQLQPGDPISSISLYSKRGIGSYFESCQPDSGTIGPYYSPGVCPSGQTIATIIEYSTASATGGGSDRQWAAICCLRYVWSFIVRIRKRERTS
jgi:hypothetical protein